MGRKGKGEGENGRRGDPTKYTVGVKYCRKLSNL
jgi:hypothetical protein